MRITCPTCSTQYEVDENDISFSGQDVQCSECMTIWTQARGGEATNPRSADSIVSEDKSDDDVADVSEAPDEAPEEETVSDLNFPDEPEEAPVKFDYPDIADSPEEDTPAVAVEEPEDEAPEAVPTEPEAEIAEPTQDTDDDIDDDENPIWKEIAALAQEASDDAAKNSSEESQYTPPDSIPPIQETPVVPDEQEPIAKTASEGERPWEAAAEAEEEGFSDFVWNDPSKEDDEPEEESPKEDEANPGDTRFTPLADTAAGKLDDMDDDVIAAALNEQMAIEDELEGAPQPEGRDIANIPVELGGPRRRTPNVDALKDSVRSKSVKLTKEEEQEQVPARRFRRGLSLILLIFVILLAVYVSENQIVEYLPAAGPYLETYGSYVDILRANAEVFAANMWELILQGVDWVKAKIDG